MGGRLTLFDWVGKQEEGAESSSKLFEEELEDIEGGTITGAKVD